MISLSRGLRLGLSNRGRGLPIFTEPVDDPSGSDGEADGLDQGTIIYDGGFADAPTFGNQGNGKRVGGTTTDFAKFLFSIGTPTAGHVYTMTYNPDFSGLSQTGKLAMVGFGFKSGNAYHFTGLKGDGDTGLNANKASGPNFKQLKAGTETDGGAATHGTQAGPNWLQIEISEAGDTYTLRTSSAGTTWADEFTDDLPTPLSEATDASDFGIAIYLDGEDVGAFTVDITLWEAGAAPAEPVTGVFRTAAVSTEDVSTRIFTSIPFGDASADRVMAVVVSCMRHTSPQARTFDLQEVYIGGVLATKRAEHGNPTTSGRTCQLWTAPVPTGTSGSVQILASAFLDRWAIDVYSLDNNASVAEATTGTSVNLDIPAGAFVISGMGNNLSDSISWTGLDRNSNRRVSGAASVLDRVSSASRAFESASPAHAISHTGTGAPRTVHAAFVAGS